MKLNNNLLNIKNTHSTSETDVYSANYVNGLVEKNVIEGIISSNITMNGSSSDTQINLIQNQKIGNKLSISNGRIVIGSGISAVRVSTSVQYNGASTGYLVIRIQLIRNNEYTQFGLLVGNQGNENTLTSGLNLAQVQEGDEIRLVYNSPTTNTISKDATKLYVEAI